MITPTLYVEVVLTLIFAVSFVTLREVLKRLEKIHADLRRVHKLDGRNA